MSEARESGSNAAQVPTALSFVVPVYNEADSLPALHRELSDVCDANQYTAELIFVDDGSTDGSWSVIERLSRHDHRIRGIQFRRNFGKAAALNAGFAAAKHPIVLTLDADLQDDPQEVPRFLEEMQRGKDVVSGWKQVRHDPFHKRYPSKVFNALVGWMTGVKLHDHNCGYKCYRREIFDEVTLYGELHRFVPVLAAARGWQVGEIVVNHRPRQHGQSKYGLSRFVKGFLDLLTVVFLTGYSHRPQHLLGTLGLVAFLFGGLGMSYLAVYWLIRISSVELQQSWAPVHERPLLIYSVGAFILGAQLLSIGFLAELITANSSQRKSLVSIRANIPPEPDSTCHAPSSSTKS